jgi:DnaJ-class molecular chaperone
MGRDYHDTIIKEVKLIKGEPSMNNTEEECYVCDGRGCVVVNATAPHFITKETAIGEGDASLEGELSVGIRPIHEQCSYCEGTGRTILKEI